MKRGMEPFLVLNSTISSKSVLSEYNCNIDCNVKNSYVYTLTTSFFNYSDLAIPNNIG